MAENIGKLSFYLFYGLASAVSFSYMWVGSVVSESNFSPEIHVYWSEREKRFFVFFSVFFVCERKCLTTEFWVLCNLFRKWFRTFSFWKVLFYFQIQVPTWDWTSSSLTVTYRAWNKVKWMQLLVFNYQPQRVITHLSSIHLHIVHLESPAGHEVLLLKEDIQ